MVIGYILIVCGVMLLVMGCVGLVITIKERKDVLEKRRVGVK